MVINVYYIERVIKWVISCFLFTIEGDEDEMLGCWNFIYYLTSHSRAILMLLQYEQTENIIYS